MLPQMFHRTIALTLVLASTVVAAPKLVITEIMYDPTSPESDDQQTEWVEIQNLGEQTINLQGYQITSGSKTRPHDPKQRFVIRDAKIEPGKYLLIGVGSASAYAPFNLPHMGVYCDESHYAWLTNGGDSVAIRDDKGKIIDEVVYSDRKSTRLNSS